MSERAWIMGKLKRDEAGRWVLVSVGVFSSPHLACLAGEWWVHIGREPHDGATFGQAAAAADAELAELRAMFNVGR